MGKNKVVPKRSNLVSDGVVKKTILPPPRPGRVIATIVSAPRKPEAMPPRPRPPISEHNKRMAKTVYRPWSPARIFEAKHKVLREREWELRRLMNAIEQEVTLIKSRLPLNS